MQHAGPDLNASESPESVAPEQLRSATGLRCDLPLIQEPLPVEAASAPAPPKPTRIERLQLTPLDIRTLVGIAAVAFLANLALRTGLDSIIAAFSVGAVVALMLRHKLIAGAGAKLMALGALGLAFWLPMRATPWLVSLNVLTITALLVGAVVIGRYSMWSIHPAVLSPAALRSLRIVHGPLLLAHSALSLVRRSNNDNSQVSAVARGVLLALIPLVPIVALLASADAVFASLLRTPGDVGSLMAHAVLTAVAAAMVAGLFTVHLGPEIESDGSYRRPLGTTEVTVVLVGLVVVFSAFALSQVVTATGGATHIMETADLTRSEYAREGFFQLLAVSVLTLGVLFVARIFTRTDDRRANFRLTVLATIASLLTLVIVAVSLLRLTLYVQAFGLTMLRLYSMLFGGLIATVFVLYIAHLIAPSARLWFVPAVSLVAWALLFGLNASNPEAFVAQWNLGHQATLIEFDDRYAAKRPPDAIPTLIAGLDQMPAEAQERFTAALCRWRSDLTADSAWGPLGWNQSRSAAADAVASLGCPV